MYDLTARSKKQTKMGDPLLQSFEFWPDSSSCATEVQGLTQRNEHQISPRADHPSLSQQLALKSLNT